MKFDNCEERGFCLSKSEAFGRINRKSEDWIRSKYQSLWG